MSESLNNSAQYVKTGLVASLLTLVISSPGFLYALKINGAFCYALDDSFIMMAIAKNLAFHQIWGLTAHGFSSTASSPLFVVLLAGLDLLFGEHILTPLLINVCAWTGLNIWLAGMANRWQLNSFQTWFLLLGLFVFMPVPVLLFGSMEHIIHTWIALYCLCRIVEKPTGQGLISLMLMGAALSGIRYEGLFEGALLVLWLWYNKEWKRGLILGVGLVLPVATLGVYSIAQGWFFLPNSLVLKGYGMNIQETGNLVGFLLSWLSKAANHPHAIVAVLVLYLCQTWKGSETHQNKIWIGLVLGMSLLHFVFARYNHVYRYEAYLMGMAWVVYWKSLCQSGLIQKWRDVWKQFTESPIQTILFIALLYSPLHRSIESYLVGARAMVNIFDQQVQTARFVKQFYNQDAVGAIDVGAIAYYSDCKLLDLWGLADLDMAKLKLAGLYTPDQINAVCRSKGMKIAVAYGNQMVHPDWEMQESWVIENNVVCSRDTVSFYAFPKSNGYRLKQNLQAFHKQLPPTVKVIRYSNTTIDETH